MAQPGCVPYDVAANARAHAAAVRAAGARVVIFPELSLTGYELDAPPVAVTDPRLAPLVAACAETGSLALAGAPAEDGTTGTAHIATLAVDADGVTVAYRKMFPGGAEPARFVPGERPAVLDVAGHRLGLGICRDLGVPEHAARTAALGIDVYAAGVLEHAEDAAVTDERARHVAAAHGVWVAVASFAGTTGGGYRTAAGRSGVWAPGGALVARAGPETGAVVTATTTRSFTARDGRLP